MKLRISLLGIVLGAALVLPALSAQESIISEATGGIFTDDLDAFLDPNDYGDVEFDKAAIFVKGSPRYGAGNNKAKGTSEGGILGGFATRLGGLYLGFSFETNLWGGEKTIKEVDGDRNDGIQALLAVYNADPITFDGAFNLLLGTENLGAFTLGLDFEEVFLDTYKNDEGKGIFSDPTEASFSDGILDINLGWGKNFELKGGVLAPEIHLGYKISTAKLDIEGSDAFTYIINGWDLGGLQGILLGGPDPDDDDTRELFFEDMSHLYLNPAAEYTSSTGAHFFSVGYTLDIGIHPKTVAKFNEKDIDWNGYDVRNTLEGEYTRNVQVNDRFALGFGGTLGLELRSSKIDYTDIPDPIEYVDFTVNPSVKIAATYDFAAKPFQVYTGLSSINSNETPLYTLSYATYQSGDDTVKSYMHAFSQWGLNAGLGLKFTPFDNFILDIGLSQQLYDDLSFGIDFNDKFVFALQGTVKF